MSARDRPLSPHLQVYRWQMGNTLSVLHRFTGLCLSLGLLALTAWLVAAAGDAGRYAAVRGVLCSPLGVVVLIGASFAFFYHLLNGVRHLIWDAGHGFERRERHAGGWLAVGGSMLLTALLWILIWRLQHPR